MPNHRLTQEEFLKNARAIHGDFYDYSLAVYTTGVAKVRLVCSRHGAFEQRAVVHMSGSGCSKCAREADRLSIDDFVARTRKIHGDRYDYSRTIYGASNKTKVTIVCRKHGPFKQIPNSHLSGYGCPKCGIEEMSSAISSSATKFIRSARKIHGRRYDYSQVVYKGNKTEVRIICSSHGVFKQKPNGHLTGQGCSKCGVVSRTDARRLTAREFIATAKKVHGNRYNYSKVVYTNNRTKVRIICPRHGVFEQTPAQHSHHGCQYCKKSKGEEIINAFLRSRKENFKRQAHIIPTRTRCSFDFHLPDRKILIEFQGSQHYYPVSAWGGIKTLRRVRRLDRFKSRWARQNGFRLLVIPYTRNVERFLRKSLAA